MTTIAHRLEIVRERIAAAEARYGRARGSVRLLAVSKTHAADKLREAFAAGQTCFAESYPQEAMDKIAALADLPIEWHFIGPIQSNKTRDLATHFAWVHGVDREKIARRLNEQRDPSLPPLNVCIQVNVSGEATKSGVALDEVAALAHVVRGLPSLCLRGLMTIPAPSDDFEQQRRAFRVLRTALERLQADGYGVDTLSMGMSDDLEAAIAEGASIVRIGTAIFGARE